MYDRRRGSSVTLKSSISSRLNKLTVDLDLCMQRFVGAFDNNSLSDMDKTAFDMSVSLSLNLQLVIPCTGIYPIFGCGIFIRALYGPI